MTGRDDRLLPDLLIEAAHRRGPELAVASAGSRMSYEDLLGAATALGAGLREAGVRPGDRVAIAMANDVPAAVATLGVLFAGAAFVLLHPEATRHTADAVLRISGASTLIADPAMSAKVEGARERVPTLRTVIARGTLGDDEAIAWEEVSAAGRSRTSPPAPDPTDLAALVFTSGTSGEPKGVMMTHGNLGFLAGSIASSLGLEAGDRVLSVLSLAHTYGLSWLIAALHRGASLFLERSFAYPAVVRERILQEEVTVFPGVPTVFAMLLALHRRSPIAFPSVTTVTCAGGALLPSFHPGMREIFPRAGIVHMYGQTECMRVSALPPELLEERPTSCGRAIPGTETVVLSADGIPVGPGEVGTLHVRGPHVTPGYFGAPELTAHILRRPDGAAEPLLCTHDLFRVDEDGFLHFVGRGDEIVKTRGEKVSPTEVENALHAIPGIREAAVVGVPDDVLGEAIRAYVVVDPEDGLDGAAIVAACRGALEGYKVPREVVILDELPRTPTGKILKRELAALVATGDGPGAG
jgi:acyl-CoA synthetase (AMP-forming)/AMP-acid ligase II